MGRSASHSFAITEEGTPDVVTALSVDSMQLAANTELTQDETGSLYDFLIGIRSIQPKMSATTKSVQEGLRLFGLAGGCIKAAGPISRVEQFFEGKTSCASASSPHLGFYATAGCFYLETLTARRGQEATLSMVVDLLSGDGDVAPVTMTSSATLPTSINTETYVMGVPEIAGITFDEATSVTLAFNVEKSEVLIGWGSIYPVDVSIIKVRPEIRIENADLDLLKDAGVPLTGKDAVHADTLLPFRKKLNRGAFVDDATEEHFSLTASGLFYFDTPANASGNQAASNTLVLKAAKESSTAPIVFSFAEAYAG